MKSLFVSTLLGAFLGAASAAPIDFESVATGTYNSLTTEGVTFTFTAGNGNFRVETASPGAPIAGKSLISYRDNEGEGNFRASTAGGFSSFSIGCGDFGADDDVCILEAFDSLNNLLDSDSYTIPAGSSTGGTLSVSSSTSIAYVLFRETGSFAGAIYWDNASFEQANAVPEPAGLALALAALGGFVAARRRQS